MPGIMNRKDLLFLFGAPFHFDAIEPVVPLVAAYEPDRVKIFAGYFRFKIGKHPLERCERRRYLDCNLISFFDVEGDICSDTFLLPIFSCR